MILSKEALNSLFESFKELKVLIIGDVMIDAYYWGKVDRISPEAPVPIVAVNKREARLGGAANVALNIQAMGAEPILCSVIGKDDEGKQFLELLKENQQSTAGILSIEDRQTTQKTRIIGNQHQMLRIDAEEIRPLSAGEESLFFEQIASLIEKEKVDAVIFEDYDKGCITEGLIQKVVELCRQKSIPTTVDPKKQNFTAYHKVSLFKPNLKELKEGLKIDFDHKNIEELEAAIQQLEQSLGNERTLITLSEAGVYLKAGKDNYHVPAHRRDITDVSGAGDTVISVATLCLALGSTAEVIAELSNLAGGLVCENVGVVPIRKEVLLTEAQKLFAS
jgi:rfaE bifunctional protein kinase chain/domain